MNFDIRGLSAPKVSKQVYFEIMGFQIIILRNVDKNEI